MVNVYTNTAKKTVESLIKGVIYWILKSVPEFVLDRKLLSL